MILSFVAECLNFGLYFGVVRGGLWFSDYEVSVMWTFCIVLLLVFSFGFLGKYFRILIIVDLFVF